MGPAGDMPLSSAVLDRLFSPRFPAPARMPRLTDRIWDAAALVLVMCGIGLFVFARRALTSIGGGTYQMPDGVAAVAQTDRHVAQSRLGLFIIVLGVLLGVVAAVRHKLR